MKRISRPYLLAFARECLKLEYLLSESDERAELDKILTLVRSMEKSGGISALEELLRPEPAVWDSAVGSAAKKASSPLKGAQAAARRPL